MWSQKCRYCGSEHLLFRVATGTQALRAGADLRQVQDLLAQADPKTTSIYAHVGDRCLTYQ